MVSVRWLLPEGVAGWATPILIARALRGFADGYVAVLLPAYLLALGLGPFEVGMIASVTLAGSALATLGIGVFGHRFAMRSLLLAAALLMAGTGLGFAGFSSFWPLAIVAFFGTLNPSSGDVSLFLPLEQARLAQASVGDGRPALFARYTVTGSLCAAVGALASGIPAWLAAYTQVPLSAALTGMFVLYGCIGATIWLLYRKLPGVDTVASARPAPLGASRAVVFRLAALFSIDAFAGGLVVNALLALWLFDRFGLSLAAAGVFFFWAGLATTGSQLLAPVLARRIGLLKTMVYTHVPSNLCLIAAALSPGLATALGFLLLRSALSQMDVPARSAFVMSVVTPSERAAAASFTAVPRSLAAAVSPSLAGALLAAGWLAAPLVLCGSLKTIYDFALFFAFRRQKVNDDEAHAD